MFFPVENLFGEHHPVQTRLLFLACKKAKLMAAALSWCKNFNVAQLKIFKRCKHVTLILAYHDKVRDAVVAWFRLLTSNHLPLTTVGSNPNRDLDSFMWGSYPASLGNVGGFTQVFLHQ
jgi:hypothetical protein